MTYEFETQLALGKEGEARIDAILGAWFEISPVSGSEERRLGIDRRIVHREHNWPLTAEYKSDSRAATSGNGFIETLSVVKQGNQQEKLGWARKSQADVIVHFIPSLEEIRFLSTAFLRHWCQGWITEYPSKDIPNNGWTTRGVLVPLKILDKTVVIGSVKARQKTLEWALS